MLIKYDQEVDAKYISVHARKVVTTQQIKPWLLFDLDSKKQVVGIEILDASKHPVMAVVDDFGVNVIEVLESNTPAIQERDARQEFITGRPIQNAVEHAHE